MRFLVFSDLHLHPYSGGNTAEEYYSAFVEILDRGREGGFDFIAFAGDFFESPTTIDSKLFNRALKSVIALPIPFIACSGNHDNYDYKRTSSTLESLYVGQKKVAWEFPTGFITRIKWLTIVVVHYNESPDAVMAEIRRLCGMVPKGEPILLITHQTVIGTSYRGMDTSSGLNPDELKDLADFSIVGHIHDAQATRKLRGSDGRYRWVMVPGSPVQNNVGDIGKSRGYYVIEWEKGGDPKVYVKHCFTSFREDIRAEMQSEGDNALKPLTSKIMAFDEEILVKSMGSAEDLITSYLDLPRVKDEIKRMELSVRQCLRVGRKYLGDKPSE